MNEQLVGFPVAWRPKAFPITAIEEIWEQNAATVVLALFGVTIHQVVNDFRVKWGVYQLYKGIREVERGEKAKRRARWAAYVWWLWKMGCPIDVEYNLAMDLEAAA